MPFASDQRWERQILKDLGYTVGNPTLFIETSPRGSSCTRPAYESMTMDVLRTLPSFSDAHPEIQLLL